MRVAEEHDAQSIEGFGQVFESQFYSGDAQFLRTYEHTIDHRETADDT